MTDTTATPDYSGQTALYVIFHGLWAFETRVDKILARTCIEEEHEIIAAPCNPPGDTLKPLQPGRCRLIHTGEQPRTTNQFRDDLNVIVSNKKFSLPSKQFCVIELPLPRHIYSLRSGAPENPPEIPFGGKDGEKLRPEQVSLVQILFYTVADPSKVQLVPPGVIPKYYADTDIAKLHIFAETPCPMTDTPGLLHVRDAYTKIALLFGLDIVPLAPAFEEASGIGLPTGLTVKDLLNLGEPEPGASSSKGASGSNCDPLIIDNTCFVNSELED